MNEKLKHWYDGWFYDFFIAPNQDKAFIKIKNIITDNCSVLDVGCGTGRLCFQLIDKCSKIDGVDASEKNIYVANKKYNENLHYRINFHKKDIISFLEENKMKYDYAILSYVIHEIDKEKREYILKHLSKYSDKIIVVDYISPHPNSFTGVINRIVEFLAGKAHNKNFKSYLRNGGLYGLSKNTNLEIASEIKNDPASSHIAVFSKAKNN